MTDNFETDIIERQRLALEYLLRRIRAYLITGSRENLFLLQDAYRQVSSASTMTGTSEKGE